MSCWEEARRSGLVLLVSEEDPPELVRLQRGRTYWSLEALDRERPSIGWRLGPMPGKGQLGVLLVVHEPHGARSSTSSPPTPTPF